MKLHFIDRYDALVKSLLFGDTEFKQQLYISTAGTASIGFNFDLQNENTADRVLEAMYFDPQGKLLDGEAYAAERYYIGLLKSAFYHSKSADLESLNMVVENILAARRTDIRYQTCPQFTRIEHFRFPEKDKGMALCYILTKKYEKLVDDWITSFGFDILRRNSHLLSRNSQERAVLVALASQNIIGFDEYGAPRSIPLANTFIDDNRPEAWYQIRYGLSLKNKPDTASIKRQYLQSEIFGLYDDGVNEKNIERIQCRQLYAMYNLYKEQILFFERNYNYLIAQANEEFKFTRHRVKTLEQSFSIAYNHVRNTQQHTPLMESYVNAMEQGINELVDFWSRDDDLEHEIAIAS